MTLRRISLAKDSALFENISNGVTSMIVIGSYTAAGHGFRVSHTAINSSPIYIAFVLNRYCKYLWWSEQLKLEVTAWRRRRDEAEAVCASLELMFASLSRECDDVGNIGCTTAFPQC